MASSFEKRKERLEAERRLVNAMLGNSFGSDTPATVAAGSGIMTPNWAGAIDKVARAYMAGQREETLKADEAALDKEQKAAMRQSTQDILDAWQGKAASLMAGAPGEGEAPTAVPAQAPDPKKAMALALASEFPELKALAGSMMPRPRESKYGQPFEGTDMTGRPGMFISDDQGNLQQIPIGPKAAYQTVADRLLQTNAPGGPRVGFDARPQYEDQGVGPHGGSVYKETGTGKPLFGPAPPSRVTNVLPGPTRDREGAQLDIKMIEQSWPKAVGAAERIQTMSEIENQLSSIPTEMFGPAADFRLAAMKIPQIFGAQPIQGVTSMEDLRGKLGQLMLDKIRQLAPVTDRDAQEMKAVYGSTPNTQEGLRLMMQTGIRAAAREIERHNEFVKKVPKTGEDDFARYLVDWKTVPPPAPIGEPIGGAGPAAPGSKQKKFQFNPQTGKIE